jgi:CHC2 zinc finger
VIRQAKASHSSPAKSIPRIPGPISIRARDLKDAVDFVALASRYMRLRLAGRQYVGLCPFHPERHPSLYIHPQQKIFHCFGCEAGGDVFAFIMRAEKCEFSRALEIVVQFSLRVARESAPRSGKRFRAGEGAKPLSARSALIDRPKDETERNRIIARLDATEARLRLIRATNDADALGFSTACEEAQGERLQPRS